MNGDCDGKVLGKWTNQFRKGTKVNPDDQKAGLWIIVSLSVIPSGIASILEAQHEVNLYDVWHGEKIAKLTAQQVIDHKIREWSVTIPIL